MYKITITNLTFPTNTIPAYWLQLGVQVFELTIVDEFINTIESNAFSPSPLRKLRELVLKMPLKILRNETFNALSLYHLQLYGARLHTIETNTFRMAGGFSSLLIADSVLSIGSVKIIIASLPDDIYSTSFINLQTLGRISQTLLSKFKKMHRLSLLRDGITHIEQNSFESFAETLETLSLVGNLLTILPVGVLPHQ